MALSRTNCSCSTAGLPLTVFVSPEGEILGRHQGALDEAGLQAAIDEHWGAS